MTKTLTGDICRWLAVLHWNRKYENNVVGDGEHVLSRFLSRYIQDIAWIAAENAKNCCTDGLWLIWKVGFVVLLALFSAECEFLTLLPTEGCASIQACTSIRMNTVLHTSYCWKKHPCLKSTPIFSSNSRPKCCRNAFKRRVKWEHLYRELVFSICIKWWLWVWN